MMMTVQMVLQMIVVNLVMAHHIWWRDRAAVVMRRRPVLLQVGAGCGHRIVVVVVVGVCGGGGDGSGRGDGGRGRLRGRRTVRDRGGGRPVVGRGRVGHLVEVVIVVGEVVRRMVMVM